jgi:signal transduction histidine kinase
MAQQRNSLWRARISVGSLAIVTTATAAAVALVVFPGRGIDVAGSGVWWPILLLLSFVVERFPIRLNFQGESHTLILSELPIVMGLFLLSPVELLLARIGGGFLHVVVFERQRPIKAVVNITVYLLEVVAAIAILTAVGDGVAVTSRNLVAGLAGTVIATAIGTGVVWGAIGISNQKLSLAPLIETLRISVPTSIANAGLGLAAVVVWVERPTTVWVLLPPVALLVLGYRLYISERTHRETLTMLYDLARDTHAAPDIGTALQRMVDAVRTQVRAEVVELYIVRGNGPVAVLTTNGEGELARRTTVEDPPADVHAALTDDGPLRTFDRGGRCTALTYGIDVGRGRHAVFRLREPLGDVNGFDDSTLSILAATATHATALIEDAEVHDAKNAFLNAVSHELRTPLSVVLGSAETLDRLSDRLSEEQRGTLVHRLHGQARKLDRLLHDLLDVDRLNRGVMSSRREPTNLFELAEQTVDTLDITSHSVTIEGEPVVAEADAGQLERIVENLVLNAVKYCPEGTRIAVQVRRVDDTLRLSVSDEGPGIPDPDKDRIFEPFLRLDRSHPSPGTGVGLSLVRRFVELHEGTVWVEDVEPTGSRFVVSLPVAETAEGEPQDPARPSLRLVVGD